MLCHKFLQFVLVPLFLRGDLTDRPSYQNYQQTRRHKKKRRCQIIIMFYKFRVRKRIVSYPSFFEQGGEYRHRSRKIRPPYFFGKAFDNKKTLSKKLPLITEYGIFSFWKKRLTKLLSEQQQAFAAR